MISIITPVLNGARFIEPCIRYIVRQKCLDMEHLIIDGGSMDSTVATIREYVGRYPHLRWISEKDEGQSDALNKGIAMAKGGIIGVLNVDDYYEPNALKQVAELFKTLPEPSLLIGNCNMWGDDNTLMDVNRPSHLNLTDLLIGDEVRYPFPVNPSAYFYHRSLHAQIGMYDVDEHFAMDIDFLLRAIPRAHVLYLDEVLGNYRLIGGTKTFVDREAGHMDARLHRLIRKYERGLSLSQRFKVQVLRNLFRSWRIIQNRIRKE